MSTDDWILALHLLAAFAYVGALIGFWAMLAGVWSATRPSELLAVFRLNPIMNAAVAIGAVGTLVFGIWLAVSLDAYEIWDGWVIAAIVLWAIAGGVGQRAGVEYERALTRARERLAAGGDEPDPELPALIRTRRGIVLQAVASVVAILLIIDMVWKPGA